MSQLYANGELTLHAPSSYPKNNDHALELGLLGTKNAEVRAMTIAAFRIAQNSDELSGHEMRKDLLQFLLTPSMFGHWKKTGRIAELAATYRLTQTGLDECEKSLSGGTRGYNTTEESVQAWSARMLGGDGVTKRTQSFNIGD